MSCLFALHTMQDNFRHDHGSYADSFEQLGVPLGAKLSGDTLTWNGPYPYRIVNVERSNNGTAEQYSIDARPSEYSRGSKQSFLMDYTGFIHFTDEDRGAARTDQTISPTK